MFDEDVDFARACPSPEYLFPSRSREYVGDVRAPLANHVADKCPVKRVTKRSLLAADFNSGNPEHLDYIKVRRSDEPLVPPLCDICEADRTFSSAWELQWYSCLTEEFKWCSTLGRPPRRATPKRESSLCRR